MIGVAIVPYAESGYGPSAANRITTGSYSEAPVVVNDGGQHGFSGNSELAASSWPNAMK